MDSLPNELLLHIFQLLGYEDLLNMSKVSKKYRGFCRDKYLWSYLLERDFDEKVNGLCPYSIYLYLRNTRIYMVMYREHDWPSAKKVKMTVSFKGAISLIINIILDNINARYSFFSSRRMIVTAIPDIEYEKIVTDIASNRDYYYNRIKTYMDSNYSIIDGGIYSYFNHYQIISCAVETN